MEHADDAMQERAERWASTMRGHMADGVALAHEDSWAGPGSTATLDRHAREERDQATLAPLAAKRSTMRGDLVIAGAPVGGGQLAEFLLGFLPVLWNLGQKRLALGLEAHALRGGLGLCFGLLDRLPRLVLRARQRSGRECPRHKQPRRDAQHKADDERPDRHLPGTEPVRHFG